MLIPMPAMPTQMGPPSSYALHRRPLVIFILVLQAIVCVMRMVFLLDIMGGFLMAIMIGLGIYACQEDMNITMICYWGILCMINGLFDLVKVIDYTVKMRPDMPLFSEKMSAGYNLSHFTMLMVPISTLFGVPLAYFLYKDYEEGPPLGEPPGGFHEYRGGGGAQGDREGTSEERTSLLGGSRGSTSFRAFEGQGQRLGAA